MKKIIMATIAILFAINSFSQKHEKIKAFKTAYITQELDLTVVEAEKFWPIYNAFSKQEKQYRKKDLSSVLKRIKSAGGIDSFSEKEANNILNEILTIENNLHLAKQQLTEDLKVAIPIKKILKLHRAERKFNRKLLERIKQRRNKD